MVAAFGHPQPTFLEPITGHKMRTKLAQATLAQVTLAQAQVESNPILRRSFLLLGSLLLAVMGRFQFVGAFALVCCLPLLMHALHAFFLVRPLSHAILKGKCWTALAEPDGVTLSVGVSSDFKKLWSASLNFSRSSERVGEVAGCHPPHRLHYKFLVWADQRCHADYPGSTRDCAGKSSWLTFSCQCYRQTDSREVLKGRLWGGTSNAVLLARSVPFAFVLFMISQAALLMKSWRGSQWSLSSSVRGSLRKVGLDLRLSCMFLIKGPLYERSEDVCLRVQQQRCMYAKQFTKIVNVLTSIGFALASMRCLSSSAYSDELVAISGDTVMPHDESDKLVHICNILRTEVFPVICCAVVFSSLAWIKPLPTPSSLDQANIVLAAMWIWRYCTLEAGWYLENASFLWVCRAVQGIVMGNSRLTSVLHVVVSMVDMTMFNILDVGGQRASHMYVETTTILPTMSHEKGYAGAQIGIIFFVIVLTWSFESLMVSEAEALAKAIRSDRSKALVERLLSAMCDCVVYLDTNCNILQPCPKLAQLLMRPSLASAAIAKPLTEFLAPDEQPRFWNYLEQERLHASSSGEKASNELARALHFNLVDASGMQVPVEVFAASIEDSDGVCFHVVGIQEAQESGWRPIVGHGPTSGTALDATRSQSVARGIDELSCSNHSNASSVTDEVEIVEMELCEELGVTDDTAALWIDWDSCCIVRCTSSFLSAIGPSSIGKPFNEWLTPECTGRFNAGLQHIGNAFFNDIEPAAAAFCIEQLTFRPPGTASASHCLEISATCWLDYKSTGDGHGDGGSRSSSSDGSSSAEHGLQVARLVLTDIRHEFKRTSSRRSGYWKRSSGRLAAATRGTRARSKPNIVQKVNKKRLQL